MPFTASYVTSSSNTMSLPAPSQLYNQCVVSLDKDSKVVTLSDGSSIKYKSLLSTLPLDQTLRWLGKPEWADGLQHSSSHIIGFGIRGLRWAGNGMVPLGLADTVSGQGSHLHGLCTVL